MVCFRGSERVEWWNCHDLCETGDSEEVAYQALKRAAIEGNVQAVMELYPQVPKRAALNLERSSIQLKSCDGRTMIANIVLTDRQLSIALDKKMQIAASLEP